MPSPDQIRTLETQIAPAAISSESLTGVPAEATCAQCVLESAWLTKLSGRNNAFGIKGLPGSLHYTHEWFTAAERSHFLSLGGGRTAELDEPRQVDAKGRTKYVVQDYFRDFDTLSDCFTRHALLLTEGRYQPHLKAYREGGTVEQFVRGIAPIYATSPSYADSLLAIIRMPQVANICQALRTATSGYARIS